MIINSGNLDPRTVDIYDFTFQSGLFTTVTVDREAGDIIDYTHMPLATIFRLSEKPSTMDSKALMPAEEITIYMNHVVIVQHHESTRQPVSPEQKDYFRDTIHQLSATKH